jgi:hypothetical protein
MKKVLIIGPDRVVIHLKHCLEIVCNDKIEVVEEKNLKMSFEFLASNAESAKEAINKFVESMKEANFNKSFEPEPSKFISKPRNNFKKR